jgi:hypothetical protein
MSALDKDQFLNALVEVMDVLLRHWILAITATIVVYLLKNKFSNGLNGVPGPFVTGMSKPNVNKF